MKKIVLSLFVCMSSVLTYAQNVLADRLDAAIKNVEPKVIAWRRDLHQNPELGNLEVRTAGIVAKHLRSLGIQVTENVAVTGVVGILKGGKPGPVMALRADMDALPVTERGDLPFKSTVTAEYNGKKTGVMHACGHDSHVAILMGTAEVLASLKSEIAGTIKFIFQPAEEGIDNPKEPFGADGMIKAGVLENPKVDAIFGLHINSQTPVGVIAYRPGPTMAAVDFFHLKIMGRQTHGAAPWEGIDPIVASSQIVNNIQTIVSRSVNITEAPAVVTVGAINGGIRENIIPEEVKMIGTIRTYGKEQKELVHSRLKTIVDNTAESNGCKADLKINTLYPATINHVGLTELMLPSLKKSAGNDNVRLIPPRTGAEDFSFYQEKVPGFFFFLGGMDPKADKSKVAAHHTPDFYLDESGFGLGVKAFCNLIFDYPAYKNIQSINKQ
ncbi:MAG: amidohydrolase [Leadbetterella sp.]